jgi:hypothetical protein
MKKYLQFILLLPFIVSCQKIDTRTKEFLKEYDKIKLISYNTCRDTYTTTENLEIINDTIRIPKITKIDNIVLNKEYSEKILNILLAERKSGILNDCYYPRHVLLFYKNHKLVGFYEFSVACGGCYRSNNINIKTIYTEQGKELIEIFKEMKLKNNGEESDTYKYF